MKSQGEVLEGRDNVQIKEQSDGDKDMRHRNPVQSGSFVGLSMFNPFSSVPCIAVKQCRFRGELLIFESYLCLSSASHYMCIVVEFGKPSVRLGSSQVQRRRSPRHSTGDDQRAFA